jgi:hypothetical protein
MAGWSAPQAAAAAACDPATTAEDEVALSHREGRMAGAMAQMPDNYAGVCVTVSVRLVSRGGKKLGGGHSGLE